MESTLTRAVEPRISIDCPYCSEAIYEPLSWFKKDYSTCPACQQGLAAGQFATLVANYEQARLDSIEEMLGGPTSTSCCDKGSSCCK